MTGANVTIPGVVGATEIGRGGFGVVYRAEEAELGRDVAVKILSGELDERTRSRFERERRAMGTLSSHPNIITIFRSGNAENGAPYLVMEYLPGGSLAEHIATTGPTQWEDMLRIGVELSGALESAHRAGVLHRDVKPGNIMMDNLGRSKLGDFGIARLDGSPETKSSVITASVAHAPPEVIAGDKPDERSDIYSLASTLYELASGAPAFVRPTDESMIPMFARIVHEPAPDLRQRGIPDPVAAVLERAMAKDASHRYPTAAEFGRALIGVQRQLGVSETKLWIEGEGAQEPAAPNQYTQVVPPPQSGTATPPAGAPPQGPGPGYPGNQPAPPTGPSGPGHYAPGQPAPGQQVPGQQPPAQYPTGPQGPGPAYPAPQGPTPQPVAQQFAPPTGTGPSTGYVNPPGQSGGFAPPQQPVYTTQQTGGSNEGSRVGLIVATVLGALVLLVGGIAVVTRDNGDEGETDPNGFASGSTTTTTELDSSSGFPDDTTTTTQAGTTTTTTVEAASGTNPPRPALLAGLPSLPELEEPYTDYRSVRDADDAFSLDVPVEWVDDLPTEGQVIASPDNNAALADERISGILVSGTQGVGAWDADFFLDELLALLADPDAPCSPVLREPYDDGFFDGVLYAELCGGGQLLVVDIVVSNPNRDGVIFFGMQMTDERDIAAFERAIDSFILFDPALLPPVE